MHATDRLLKSYTKRLRNVKKQVQRSSTYCGMCNCTHVRPLPSLCQAKSQAPVAAVSEEELAAQWAALFEEFDDKSRTNQEVPAEVTAADQVDYLFAQSLCTFS